MDSINLKLTNNTNTNQSVSLFGVVPNLNSSNNINNIYQFDLTGQSFVGINSVSITYAPTNTMFYTTVSASVISQNIQGVVDALNTLGIGVFSVNGNVISVGSDFYVYQNINIGLPFVSTWNTKNTSTGSSASNQVKLPLVSNGTYNFTVDWGDGSIDIITSWNQAETLHTYLSSGTYTITIVGICKGIRFGDNTDRLKILSVSSWGDFELAIGNAQHFYKCTNLDLTFVSDVLHLGSCNDLQLMFGNYSFATINNIELWDVSNVVSTEGMFFGASLFNSDISGWNTFKFKNTKSMFYNALSFNQPIGSWNVSNVTDMESMFSNATAFNQDISSWDISKVINFSEFMTGKTNLNYSSANLDSIYNNWSLLSVQPNVTISFGTIKYTLSGQAGKDILDFAPNNWTISDGGL